MLKGLRKGNGKGKNTHWNFHTKAKGNGLGSTFGKGNGKGSGTSLGTSVSNKGGTGKQASGCWTCGRPGHFSDRCPQRRVHALVEELWNIDLGLNEEIWNEHTWDEGDFGDKYVGSLDDFVDQLWRTAPLDATWDATWESDHQGIVPGMTLGTLLKWRLPNFLMGVKPPSTQTGTSGA